MAEEKGLVFKVVKPEPATIISRYLETPETVIEVREERNISVVRPDGSKEFIERRYTVVRKPNDGESRAKSP